MKEKHGCVYLLTNKSNKVLYTGVTSNLPKRIWEHKNKVLENSFTNRYNLDKLVWYEMFGNLELAILQEKRIKRWKREYKENKINGINPEWRDLSEEIN